MEARSEMNKAMEIPRAFKLIGWGVRGNSTEKKRKITINIMATNKAKIPSIMVETCWPMRAPASRSNEGSFWDATNRKNHIRFSSGGNVYLKSIRTCIFFNVLLLLRK
ncbi:hypothetical protein GOBAR_DD17098 [Gossypium barbadense]|nr:hypothetical protein GOBAR_DD17098 [Gossypium barbadense]